VIYFWRATNSSTGGLELGSGAATALTGVARTSAAWIAGFRISLGTCTTQAIEINALMLLADDGARLLSLWYKKFFRFHGVVAASGKALHAECGRSTSARFDAFTTGDNAYASTVPATYGKRFRYGIHAL
jgi:hypothetical protein